MFRSNDDLFWGKLGRFGKGCFGSGGVLTCIHHLPLLSVDEVNRGTLNIFIITIKIRYLILTFVKKLPYNAKLSIRTSLLCCATTGIALAKVTSCSIGHSSNKLSTVSGNLRKLDFSLR